MKTFRYLITGAGGTIGSALVERLIIKKNSIICIYDNNEKSLFDLLQKYQKYNKRLRVYIGDIRDKHRLLLATKKVDVVFHCAALKHVFLSEYNPFEVKKTNLDGVENIIESSIQNKVKKVIFTSSDKAVNPTNIMGVSKMMGERLFISSNNRVGDSPTKFACVRFGNVLDSSGSILQIFKDQIKNKKPLTVTDKEMTRFFLTIKNAIDLCIFAENNMIGGEIFIKSMGSLNIHDLALLLQNKNSKINIIGKKIGEKVYEELLSKEESHRAYIYKRYILLIPELNDYLSNDQKKRFKNISSSFQKFKDELRSDTNLFNMKQIKKFVLSNLEN